MSLSTSTFPEAGSIALNRGRRLLTGATLFGVLILAGAVFAQLLARYYLIPDADQTIVGLMARHIRLGELPVFYWGQPYTGSGEAYITAALFALFGKSDYLLHAVPFAATIAYIGLTIALARRCYGATIAAATAAFFVAPPMLLVQWGTWAGSGYLEAMTLGTAAILLALPGDKQVPNPGRLRLISAFFLLGLALWVQPIAVVYVGGVLAGLISRAVLAIRRPRAWAISSATVVICLAALVAGALPLVVFNLQHDGATLSFLSVRATHLSHMQVLARFILWAGPVLLGCMPPSTDRMYFLDFVQAHYAFYGLALFFTLVLYFRAISNWRAFVTHLDRAFLGKAPRETALIAVTFLTLIAYLGTGWGAEQWAATEPRYLLPLYSAVPLAARLLLPVKSSVVSGLVALALLGVLLLAHLFADTSGFPRRDLRPLAAMLEARDIRAIYGDYWLVYPVTYYSDERVLGIATSDDLGNLHNNRYSPYLRAAAATPNFAWVVAIGSARERSLVACVSRLKSQFSIVAWQDQHIYLRPSGAAFPWWNGGRCSSA